MSHHRPKSIVYITVHSWCGSSHRSAQMYNDMCPSIWHFHYTKNTLCFSYSFPVPSTLASTDLFTVSIVLPFQACCIVGLRQYVAFFRLTISLGKPVLEKAEEQEIKLPTSAGSSKKQENSRKTSISALLTMPKPLTVWITINCGKFWKRWEYQTTWPASWETCVQVRKQQLELDMEQQTGSK